MISNPHFKNLEFLNTELARSFEKLKKERASKNKENIEKAEIRYFQTLQTLYQGTVTAANTKNVQNSP